MKIYDSEFGRQPEALELQVGSNLPSFLEGAEQCRKKILDELGLPLPPIKVSDSINLKPFETVILLYGTEVAKNENDELDNNAVCVWLEKIVKDNITIFLNQCIVNGLLNKLSDYNPDVIDDVMFFKKFSTSNLKIILNCLLAERVAINDMNAIMETIADYIPKIGNNPISLLEKIREKLAYSFMDRLADKNKCVHAIFLSPSISDFLWERLERPSSEIELPYFYLEYKDCERVIKTASEKIQEVKGKSFFPVFICPSEIRPAFSHLLSEYFLREDYSCISIDEYKQVESFFSIVNEGELFLDE